MTDIVTGEDCAKIAESMPSLFSHASEQREQLSELLHRVFGHREFRAHQREVCEAAAAGRDVLLVMPTGAGKSLCYQLPSLARASYKPLSENPDMGQPPSGARTGLVISPLIALMDDQASKLAALGLRVARIHSGMDRESSRQACWDYLAGELDFLFIAPERLRVPGFPEMLAKRKPALVAIDEAHCISQWGHDFRPDYRTLGQHLPALRPAPVIALTATATPAVQKDIVAQLSLHDPAVFITGFRRDNLAVEVIELSKPQRPEFALKLLKDEAARPAILYAGSRKQAEELADYLGRHFPAAAYHAGLEGAKREKVQKAFLSGKLDVVVATVAFGMGVDKADVRTVIHVALPGSVEAYYQEIGRAGRDGKTSRTILLHGFADRRLQEFLLDKSYPPTTDLERVARALTDAYVTVDSLQVKLKMEREVLDRALEKLLAAGVALMDMSGDVCGTGEAKWQRGYEAQVANRRAQIDRMVAYAESNGCRMVALVEHFGDLTDKRQACGLCDVCNPGGSGANAAHQPGDEERRWLRAILKALDVRSTSTGKLFTDLALMRERKDFDALLDGLARAGLIVLANDTFTNPEGKEITYKKATITHEGRDVDDRGLDTVWIRGVLRGPATQKGKIAKKAAAAPVAVNPEAEALFAKLKDWRTEVARPTKTPAFMILSDAVLRAIAVRKPETLAELHGVSGMGPAKVDRYGAAVLGVCRGEAVVVAVQRKRDGATKATAGDGVVREKKMVLFEEDKKTSGGNGYGTRGAVAAVVPVELNAAQQALEGRLKEWRMAEAKAAGLPSFFILSDTTLKEIARVGPRSVEELRGVSGVGAEKVAKFGAAVVAVCSA